METYNKYYYQKNKKKLKKRARLYGAKHREQAREWHKAWAKKHPLEVLANKKKWRIVNRKINTRSLTLAIEVLEKVLLTIKS